jgi:superfamily II DNA or RNA helicase
MLVQPGNVYTTVLRFDGPGELEMLTRALTYKQPGYFFTKAYQDGYWDGSVCFLHRDKTTGLYSFLTGLTQLASTSLQLRVKARPNMTLSNPLSSRLLKTRHMDGPYSYQKDCLEKMAVQQRGILDLATNAGKTYIAAAFTEYLGFPTLFLVNTEDLLLQARDVFTSETTQVVHLLGAGFDEVPPLTPGHVTVGLIGTVFNRTCKKPKSKAEQERLAPYHQWLAGVKVVFADECHLASGETYKTILENCTGAAYRFGMSGTPLECDVIRNTELIGSTGPVIFTITNDDLIRLGVSAKPVVHVHKIEQLEPSEIPLDDDYPAQYHTGIVVNPYRNTVVLGVVRDSVAQGKQTLVLVHSVEHGELLLALMKDSAIDAEFCYGETDKKVRYSELTKLRGKKRKVLILSKIGEVGLDIPALDVIVRASGGLGTISTLQSIGRGLRKKAGHSNLVEYHDFYDSMKECPYLRQHSEQRIEDYRKEGFDVRCDYTPVCQGRKASSPS